MDKIVLRIYKGRFWNVGEVYKNGIKIADINLFYSVSSEWIYIFETCGGQGTGYEQGNLIQKIFIGNCEFSKIIVESNE